MPKYYCDYCDIFLTHDSPSVRKSHNEGWKHKAAVRTYYAQFEEDQTQSLIDQKVKEFEGRMAQFGVFSGGVFPGGPFPPPVFPGGPGGAPFFLYNGGAPPPVTNATSSVATSTLSSHGPGVNDSLMSAPATANNSAMQMSILDQQIGSPGDDGSYPYMKSDGPSPEQSHKRTREDDLDEEQQVTKFNRTK